MKTKIPGVQLLGCSLYIEKDEDSDGESCDYAKMAGEALSYAFDRAYNSPELDFPRPVLGGHG